MRVSLLVVVSLVGVATCQQVAFRDSMLGSMLSGSVAGARNTASGMMGMVSTIGKGMRKVLTPVGFGSRRQNTFRGGQSGPNSSSGPNRPGNPRQRRPQRQQFRPQRQQRPQQQASLQQFDDDQLQRLSGDEILDFASSGSPRFRNRFRQRQKQNFIF
ncbi:unnamed protein product [Meganyctiphanes norvegica]|uniref:Uncharacterized protein n=1 Tax=Meganyctiphanes norvegica TaxID=48144 RepID=A0AAV2RW34_MEGNR